MGIHEFLYNNHWWVCVVTVPVGVYFARQFVRSLGAPAQPPVPARSDRRPIPPPPPPKPQQQQLLGDRPQSPSAVAGTESRLERGHAKTAKLKSVDDDAPPPRLALRPVTDDRTTTAQDEVAITPGTGGSTKSSDTLQRANRLEQIGFHHSIESLKTPPPGSITETPVVPTPAVRPPPPPPPVMRTPVAPAPSAPPAPTAVPAVPAETSEPVAGGAPELDDILARLDQVLAEDSGVKTAPAAPPTALPPTAPMPPKAPTAVEPPKPIKAPTWARADAFDEDVDDEDDAGGGKPPAEPGKQLGLFDPEKKD